MPTQQDQIEREELDIERALARYQEFLKTAPEADTEPGRKFVTKVMGRAVPALERAQREHEQKRSAPNELPILLNTLPADKLALIAVRAILHHDHRGEAGHDRRRVSLAYIAAAIGRACRYEYELDIMRNEDRDLYQLMTHRVRQMTRRSTAAWRNRCDAVKNKPWSHEDAIKLGMRVVGVLVEKCSDYFAENSHMFRGKQITTINLTANARAALDTHHRSFYFQKLSAMIVPPAPWGGDGPGGYLSDNNRPLVKFSWASPQVKDADVPFQVVQAVNALQEVPWSVNRPVLAVAQQAYDDQTPIGYMREGMLHLPERVPDREWAALDDEERKALKGDRVRIHNHNSRLRARLGIVRRQLEMANDYVNYEQVWFPYELDFRGRVYPIPLDLNPQANDFGRALLTFAEAKPLGDEGLYWLCVHTANCFGEDKLGLSERFEWTRSRLEDLDGFAQDPMDYLEFWQQADKPWQFLAACQEFHNAMTHPGSPRDYPSSLPIDLDGTCNGLQHLSALGHDPVSAAAVNMMAGERQDIYQVVADLVADLVPEESPWYGNVSRGVVKRAVMTTPYGVTDIGIRDQLLMDRFVEELGIERREYFSAANEMRDLIKAAIDQTLGTPRRIMEWFQQVAEVFAEIDQPLRWQSPTGFQIVQSYRAPIYKRIRTLAGEGLMRRPLIRTGNRKIYKRKQLNAAAPNIVHSFDAAHLIKTAQAFSDRLPGAAFSPVHDSFGTHACDVPVLAETIRQEFVKMYRSNWLLALHYEWQLVADKFGVGIPPAPDQGDLDINKVLDSTYFFS